MWKFIFCSSSNFTKQTVSFERENQIDFQRNERQNKCRKITKFHGTRILNFFFHNSLHMKNINVHHWSNFFPRKFRAHHGVFHHFGKSLYFFLKIIFVRFPSNVRIPARRTAHYRFSENFFLQYIHSCSPLRNTVIFTYQGVFHLSLDTRRLS